MKFKYINLFLFFFVFACTNTNIKSIKDESLQKQFYSSKGFALVYSENIYKSKLVKKKINNRDFVILHSYLKPNTLVKIYNPINKKSVIATVKYKTEFSKLYNSVISKRIVEEIDLNLNDTYVEIIEVNKNNKFIAKKAKTFDEEKNVANTAPVEDINIKNISTNVENISTNVENILPKVSSKYLINVVDFYYLDSAKSLKKKLNIELNLNNINIKQISKNKFRVFCGPFNSFDDIKESYFAIINLGFEQLDIVKIN